MIFQHTLDQILNYEKTQTRRIIKPKEVAIRVQYNRIGSVSYNNRTKWQLGNTYSIQPGRGKSQVARLQITKIRSEKITRITTRDAIAEGFCSRSDFLKTWKKIHGEDSLDCRVWVIEFKVVAVLMQIKTPQHNQLAQLYAN